MRFIFVSSYRNGFFIIKKIGRQVKVNWAPTTPCPVASVTVRLPRSPYKNLSFLSVSIKPRLALRVPCPGLSGVLGTLCGVIGSQRAHLELTRGNI